MCSTKEKVLILYDLLQTGFGNTFLEIMFITATEERILRKELEIVFNKCDCVQLNKLLVIKVLLTIQFP